MYFHIYFDGQEIVDDDDLLYVTSVMKYIRENYPVEYHSVATLGEFKIYYSFRNTNKYIPDYPTMKRVLKEW